MIQRVQSIYLLLITVLMSFLFVRPYAEMTLVDNQVLLFKAHVITIQSAADVISNYKMTIPVILLLLINGLLSFCTIFFYNHRIIQIRLSILNAFMLLALFVTMLLYFFIIRSDLDPTHSSFRLAMVFPILAFIFCIMAIHNIRRDEILVKSYNRIR